jgi:(2Fe-2S) ferredoxin
MPEKTPQSVPRVYVLVCKGDTCSQRGNPERVRVGLKQAVREFPAHAVKVSYVSCLGLCGDGPNVLVVEGGSLFRRCDAQLTGEIIQTVREKLGQSRS